MTPFVTIDAHAPSTGETAGLGPMSGTVVVERVAARQKVAV